MNICSGRSLDKHHKPGTVDVNKGGGLDASEFKFVELF